ncbi:uroporphyrinogen-III synthase [Agaribacterium haliotis]|uniref:uroporphyrinogen-III synthase n=1 Tax=Agaribacterium haliotis TaxID=2013869 RepID=UPI000BB54D20|nr:uroporphyrinogen-III synthase [Agaribacterium haliotis]
MLTVVAGRPEAQNRQWAEKLAAEGFQPLLAPLLAIELLDADSDAAIRGRVADLDQYQQLIFVSQNAVNAMLPLIDRWWPQLPIAQLYIAVGAATAKLLKTGLDKLGLDSEVQCTEAMNSEALLQLESLVQVQHQKILICRGQGGRPLLAEELTKRGAQVDYCELYRRLCPRDLAKHLTPVNDGTIVPVFSGEALANFSSVCANRQLELVVPSSRVERQARELGFSKVQQAENASETAMMQSIKAIAAARLENNKHEHG